MTSPAILYTKSGTGRDRIKGGTVKGPRWVVLAAALGLVGAALAPSGAAARPQQQPAGGEIGVTADTIRIAVIADVDNAARPGLFQGSVDGVNAFAKYVNANGGVAGGRKIQVDFIDSKLSADEARNALVQACQQDFVIVGTTSLFMNNIEPMTTCVDQAGRATGLPDVPVLQTEIAQQCSPISFPVIVVGLDCATKDAAQKKVTIRTGPGKYYTKRNKNLHGVFTLAGDLRSTTNAGLSQVAAARSTCDDKALSVTLSGGVSIYPGDGRDWDTLFTTADQRLYVAKQSGRNCIVGAVERSARPVQVQPSS